MATDGELRHYLTNAEVRALLRAAKQGRYGARNHAMILLAFRHGLRASEVVALRHADLDLDAGTLYCRRRKGSRSSVHPMKKDEVRVVGRVVRGRKKKGGRQGKEKEGEERYVFSSERGEKLTRGAFWRIVSEAGQRAGLPLKTYAHMLRHACGFYLANKGCDLRLIQDYLGHKQIQNTVRYAVLNPKRFRGLW